VQTDDDHVRPEKVSAEKAAPPPWVESDAGADEELWEVDAPVALAMEALDEELSLGSAAHRSRCGTGWRCKRLRRNG
jgi:hypothetical protein